MKHTMLFTRGMSTTSVIFFIIFLVGVVLFATFSVKSTERKQTTLQDTSEMIATIEENINAAHLKELGMEPAKTQSVSAYENYSPEKIARAQNGRVILFFHAAWCPTCRALSSDINQGLSRIPENVYILKTDYDTETALKKKYGVTVQHTLVEVDANGNLLHKWLGTPTLSALIEEL